MQREGERNLFVPDRMDSHAPSDVFFLPTSTERLDRRARQAHQLFPFSPDNPDANIVPLVRHGNSRETVRALEYLREHGGDPDLLGEMFSPSGEWIFPQYHTNPWKVPPNHLARTLGSYLEPVFAMIDPALDGEFPDGFNRHGKPHAVRDVAVARKIVEMYEELNDASLPSSHLITVFGGYMHDIGNMFSRKDHPWISVLMMDDLVPEAKSNPALYQKVKTAIALHSSGNLMEVIKSWPSMDFEDQLRALNEMLDPGGLAFIMADKTDMGRDRISNGASAGAIFRDPHAEVNYWGHNGGIKLSEDKNTFIWTLKYDPKLRDSDLKRYPQYAPGIAQRQRDGKIKNRDFLEWQRMVFEMYCGRIITVATGAFAISPKVKNVEIVFQDEENSIGSTKSFSRESFLEQSNKFMEQYSTNRSE